MSTNTAGELVIRDLTVAYGRRVAVNGVSLRVGADECVALVGANGAGKSTILKALVGIHKARSGTVSYGEQDMTGWSPSAVARAGITLCPEGRHLFPGMSVRDNLLMGATSSGASRGEVRELLADMEARFPVLAQRHKQLAGTLSGGEQQMVALGRALMAKPTLLILDEPSLGLAPLLVEQMLDIVKTIVGQGCAVLISEQNVEASLEVCSRAYVMEAGRFTAEGTAKELRDDPTVLAAFLGLDGTAVA